MSTFVSFGFQYLDERQHKKESERGSDKQRQNKRSSVHFFFIMTLYI